VGEQREHAGGAGRPRRLALRVYRVLPRRLRILAVRIIAPGHTVGALCFLEREDGRVLVLCQYHRDGWTLPGGLLNRGEDPARAVVREVREETGLAVAVDLPFATLVAPGSRRVDVLFHVPVTGEVPVRADGEAMRAEWLALDEIGAVDEPTATSFAAFRRWKARGGGVHSGEVLPG
jgi:ADP-ribose pyrophosphatase YjhB (NUDIX family)